MKTIKTLVLGQGKKLWRWGTAPRKVNGAEKSYKMMAKNYFADIYGINLHHAMESFEWENWLPMTDDGVTVTGFWDVDRYQGPPAGYILDAEGKFLVLQSIMNEARNS